MKKYLVIKNWITNYPNPIRVLKGEFSETNALWYKK